MRIIVTVTGGPLLGRSIVLLPGKSALIGRASWADLSVQDMEMSGRHFSIECHADRCVIEDLGSKNGTIVNGVRIGEPANLNHGDKIQTGQTLFEVRVEGAFNQPAAPVEEPMTATKLRAASAVTMREEAEAALAEEAALKRTPGGSVAPQLIECVILLVKDGPNAGKRIALKPGEQGMVGRASWADLAANDVEMSGRHFSIECQHSQCIVRDLGSKNGTIIHGKKITELEVQDGDQVVAGQTIFEVQVEYEASGAMSTMMGLGKYVRPQANIEETLMSQPAPPMPTLRPSPPPPPPPPAPASPAAESPPASDEERRAAAMKALFSAGPPEEVAQAPKEANVLAQEMAAECLAEAPQVLDGASLQLVRYLVECGEPMFALVDVAHDPRVMQLLQTSSATKQTLFEGPKDDELAKWAPWLVEISDDFGLLEKYIAEGWGKGWGILFTSMASFDEIRYHLRLFLRAPMLDDREVFLRLYDPNVLGAYLPACTPEQIPLFFNVASAFFLETKVSETVIKFTARDNSIHKEVVALWVQQEA